MAKSHLKKILSYIWGATKDDKLQSGFKKNTIDRFNVVKISDQDKLVYQKLSKESKKNEDDTFKRFTIQYDDQLSKIQEKLKKSEKMKLLMFVWKNKTPKCDQLKTIIAKYNLKTLTDEEKANI